MTYQAMRELVPLPSGAGLRLDLDLAHWAGDGLLAVFFFGVRLELKREFIAGDLRDPAQAVIPIVARWAGWSLPLLTAGVVRG